MIMDYIDGAGPVRRGEDLDRVRLEAYLKENLPGLGGEMRVSQFPGGHSNLTYLIALGEREFVLRRPPHGRKAKTAHDMGREYRVLKALRPQFPYCPEALCYCEDEGVLGAPFFVMERLKGVILRKDLPPGLHLTEAQAERLCGRLAEVLAELHRVDWTRDGLRDLGRPEGYVRRQVEGWTRRYEQARTPDAPDLGDVTRWLAERMPPESPVVSVIHNDYRFDNVVLDPADPLRIIGILDWEMATVGDPLMDLGGGLAYWVDRDDPPEMQAIRLVPTNIPGMMRRREFVDRYASLMGIAVERIDFYYVFGLFRLAVIAQQIYNRYYHGETADERFKTLIFAVHILGQAARRTMEQSDL